MSSEKADYPPPPYVQDQPVNMGYTQRVPTRDRMYFTVGEYLPEQNGISGAYPKTGSYSNTTTIVSQPDRYGNVQYNKAPTDYTLPAILACCFCFWPMGLCAIYYASQAQDLVGKGDFVAATRKAKNARNLVIGSIVIGIIALTLALVLRFVFHASIRQPIE